MYVHCTLYNKQGNVQCMCLVFIEHSFSLYYSQFVLNIYEEIKNKIENCIVHLRNVSFKRTMNVQKFWTRVKKKTFLE